MEKHLEVSKIHLQTHRDKTLVDSDTQEEAIEIDPIIGQLGTPVGGESHEPCHSTGKDFLLNFMGLVGIPIDLGPEFPAEAPAGVSRRGRKVSLVGPVGLKGLRDLETGELLAGETIAEGRGWFRSPDAGKTVVKVPVGPHFYRAFARQ